MTFQLNDDDVVSMANLNQSFAKTELCKFSRLNTELKNHLNSVSQLTMQYVETGIHCQVLKTSGGGWRKGKMRIRMELEFVPDEPEEPAPDVLDAVRSPNF